MYDFVLTKIVGAYQNNRYNPKQPIYNLIDFKGLSVLDYWWVWNIFANTIVTILFITMWFSLPMHAPIPCLGGKLNLHLALSFPWGGFSLTNSKWANVIIQYGQFQSILVENYSPYFILASILDDSAKF